MTAQTLPKKLNKEPLVDAVFEIRFSSSMAASSVLPGFFFAKLEPKEWRVESLPVAEIPGQLSRGVIALFPTIWWSVE